MAYRLLAALILLITILVCVSCGNKESVNTENFGFKDIGSITDVYYQSLEALKSKSKVMILYLDGFSWMEYEKAIESGNIPFMENNFKTKPALSVIKPVTNSGMAAMITGTTPEVNGISDRSKRDYSIPDIFQKEKELGGTAILIEGNISILNTSIEPALNIDYDGNGTDNEVFASGKQALETSPDLIMIHFHGIDDLGHKTGPYSAETTKKISEIDGYVKELSELFEGTIILTSDHGMHESGNKGDHGENIKEDMVVPYLIMNK